MVTDEQELARAVRDIEHATEDLIAARHRHGEVIMQAKGLASSRDVARWARVSHSSVCRLWKG